MTITPEQQRELEKFPEELRALVSAELASGNTIVEMGHGFPAAPVGSYIKLANKVSTRARVPHGGLDFYERNGSSYSGEFTDSRRYFFVLEPPDPPPAEPDMDAIRRSLEPRPFAEARDRREVGSLEKGLSKVLASKQKRVANTSQPEANPSEVRDLAAHESPTGSTHVLRFRDKRPPHLVQHSLENDLKALFSPTMLNNKLCMNAKAVITGVDYEFVLCFEAALPSCNDYSLRMEASWAQQLAEHWHYYRKSSANWFKFWTRKLVSAAAPTSSKQSPKRYRDLCEATLACEKHLNTVTSIQQAILAALKAGASFHYAHKEGGTRIDWRNDRFVYSSYGDYPEERFFTGEEDFLKMLFQCLSWQVTSHSRKDQTKEIDIWKLIMRRLSPNES